MTSNPNPPTITATFVIGNTDNKLTQQEWATFCSEFIRIVTSHSLVVHFCGGPSTWSTYQNLCMVAEVSRERPEWEELITELTNLRVHFRQDSIAFSPGITQFI